MSIELIAIFGNVALTGFVAWRLVRLENFVANLRATMMAQFEYLIREIRRVEAGNPVPGDGRGEEPAPEGESEPLPTGSQPVIAA